MSIAKRADGRWIVRYKPKGTTGWKQKAFRDEQTARAWESEHLASLGEQEERLTLGELTMLYFRSRPEIHHETKKAIVYFLAGHERKDGSHSLGVGEFLRDKYAESLNRQDLERMREGFRA